MSFRIMGTRLEWMPAAQRPASADVLVIPANDHLWMLSGPGLELKKAHGKEIELEAVRQGPLAPGELAVTSGQAFGYRFLYHAVVMGQDLTWVPGAGEKSAAALVDRAVRDKATSVVAYPFYQGAHGRKEEPAREMLRGFLRALQQTTRLGSLTVLFEHPEEKTLLQETFTRLLSESGS
jgi:hypothetical protein